MERKRSNDRITIVGLSKKHSATVADKAIKEIRLREYADKKMTGKRKRNTLFCLFVQLAGIAKKNTNFYQMGQ